MPANVSVEARPGHLAAAAHLTLQPTEAELLAAQMRKSVVCKACRQSGITGPRTQLIVLFIDGVCALCIEAAASYYCTVDKLVEEAKDDGFRKGLLACHTTILTKMKAWKPAYVEKKKGTCEWELSKKRQYDEAQLKKHCNVDKLPPVVMQAFTMKQEGSKKGARTKQKGSKNEAGGKQSASKKETRWKQERSKKGARRTQEGSNKEARSKQEGSKQET